MRRPSSSSSAGFGFEITYPWTRSHRSPVSRPRQWLSSTPSATTRSPRAWASSTVARTSASRGPRRPRRSRVMKLRSSLSSPTARLPRYASEVNPAPKSSTETTSPRSWSFWIASWRALEVGDRGRLGHLEDERVRGRARSRASSRSTRSGKLGSSRSEAEMLTETVELLAGGAPRRALERGPRRARTRSARPSARRPRRAR